MLDALRAGDSQVRGWLVPEGGDPFAATSTWVERFLSRAPDRWNRSAILAAAGANSAITATWAATHGALVVTGQQPAVGGGTLYTLVKTAAAIALAERCTTATRPVLPLFWCASEDHDLGEAGHADLMTRAGRIERISADLGSGRASLRYRSARSAWQGFVDACHRHCGPGAGADWLDAQSPQADDGLGTWACRLIRNFFSVNHLLAVEAWQLRPLWTDTMRKAISQWPTAALAQRRTQIMAAGFADSLGALDDPPLFADHRSGREALDQAGAGVWLDRDPSVISPGAGLRPILQQIALPAAIAVLGPGEMAYHAAITPLYAALGATHPLLVPRPSLTLVPGWLRRGCDAWGVSAATVQANTDEPASQTHILHQELSTLSGALDQLATSAVSPDLARRRDAGLTRLRRELDRLSQSLGRGERHQAGRPAFGSLIAWLWPRGAPQDRTMSLGQAIWEHGPGLADVLVAAARVCAPGDRAVVPV